MQPMNPDLERVTSPGFLANLVKRPMNEVRAMRAECQAIENGLSYVRRVAQGRIDIVAAELQRRREGGDPTDLHALVQRLPDILSDRGRAGGPTRAPQDLSVDHVADLLIDQLDDILGPTSLTDLSGHPDSDLVAVRDSLTDYERRLSHSRRAIHDVLDALQAEITRRYRTGEASVDSLLS
jgi:hypothetical protein